MANDKESVKVKAITPEQAEGQGDTIPLDNNARTNLQTADNRRKQLVGYYKEEEKVPMYLSPMYRPYFGNVMQVMVNGISIFFKVDGSTQLVPQTFADEIAGRRIRIDGMLARQEKLADVANNYESAPGELNLF